MRRFAPHSTSTEPDELDPRGAAVSVQLVASARSAAGGGVPAARVAHEAAAVLVPELQAHVDAAPHGDDRRAREHRLFVRRAQPVVRDLRAEVRASRQRIRFGPRLRITGAPGCDSAQQCAHRLGLQGAQAGEEPSGGRGDVQRRGDPPLAVRRRGRESV